MLRISVYNMYIILFSSNKNIGYVWKGIKQTLDLRILLRRDRPPPPGFEIPGSAPGGVQI